MRMLTKSTCRSWVATSAPICFHGPQPCSAPLPRRTLFSRQLRGRAPCTLDAPGPSSGEPLPSEEQGASNLSSAIHYSLSEVAKLQGRVSERTNLFLVSESEESWRRLDKRVNKYPLQRSFTGIGSGAGSVFRAAMVSTVESVVGPVHVECISERASSKGSYLSVTVGPVWVETCDQVIAIYAKLKEIENVKYIL